MKKIIIVLALLSTGCAVDDINWAGAVRDYSEMQRHKNEVQVHTSPNYYQEENARQQINDRFRRRIGVD